MKYAIGSMGMLFFLMFSVTADAGETKYVCTGGSAGNEINRLVTIEYLEYPASLPCRVMYDKSDEGVGIKVLWQASTQAGFCERKAADLVKRLSKGGYTCRQVSEALFDGESTERVSLGEAPPASGASETTVVSEAAPAETPAAATAAPQPSAPESPKPAKPVSALEQAAGVREALPKAPPVRKKAAEVPSTPARDVTAARPRSRVDSYLHWLNARAADGNKDATSELSAIKELGLASFYDQWVRIFSLLDLDSTHKPAWSIESVACEQPGCRTWLLEEGADRDEKGYYKLHSIGVLNGRVAEVITCVTFEDVSKCVDGKKPAPVATYRFISAAEGSYYVYENQFGGYALIYACSESMEPGKSWSHAINVFQGEKREPPLVGKGDCKSRILREYWRAL